MVRSSYSVCNLDNQLTVVEREQRTTCRRIRRAIPGHVRSRVRRVAYLGIFYSIGWLDCLQKNNYKEEKCRKEVRARTNSSYYRITVIDPTGPRSTRCTNAATPFTKKKARALAP
jgi:hypothetical protein